MVAGDNLVFQSQVLQHFADDTHEPSKVMSREKPKRSRQTRQKIMQKIMTAGVHLGRAHATIRHLMELHEGHASIFGGRERGGLAHAFHHADHADEQRTGIREAIEHLEQAHKHYRSVEDKFN